MLAELVFPATSAGYTELQCWARLRRHDADDLRRPRLLLGGAIRRVTPAAVPAVGLFHVERFRSARS